MVVMNGSYCSPARGPLGLFAAQCIFQSANCVLCFARCPVGFAFRFQLGVARELACRFLYGALRLLGGTLNPIFVHLIAFPITTIDLRRGAEKVSARL
jgi:hypothetical protein